MPRVVQGLGWGLERLPRGRGARSGVLEVFCSVRDVGGGRFPEEERSVKVASATRSTVVHSGSCR